MKNCNCGSDINRDGSGQLQRYLKALDPGYAPIDGRSTEDLLVYAKRYAAQIRFYDIPESKINDGIAPKKVSWREFFRRDMAVIAASVAVTDTESFKKEYDEVNERLQLNPKPEIYAALYAPIIGMLKKIDRWLSVAIPENPLYTDLKLAIDSDLNQQVQKILAYEAGFQFVDPSVDLEIDLQGVENKEIWGLNETVVPDASIYKGTTKEEKILHASLFAEDIFHAFYNFLNKLVADSEKYFQFAMEQYPAHQPHMALFITFLQLFNKAQQQMNGLTGKMLDFYYKEVLHLETKLSIPDKAHIVFELAKDVTEYDVAAGTALKAGPDKSGKEQLYKTTGDLVVNQAKVKELKTIFIEKVQKGTTAKSEYIQTMYARPVANSADGLGGKFDTADTKWPTFGKGSPRLTSTENICEEIDLAKELLLSKNTTQIGFAIASPQLMLQGGNRIIAVKLGSLKQDLSKTTLEILLSAEDGWLKIDSVIAASAETIKKLSKDGGDLGTGMPAESGYFFDVAETTLYICLPIVEKAVVPFNPALHPGKTYTTSYPVMQVLVGPGIEINAGVFQTLSIKEFSLSVRVGSTSTSPLIEAVTVTGKVNQEDGTPIQKQDYQVAVFGSNPAVVGVDSGDKFGFSISTFVNKILVFTATGYKTKLVIVTKTPGPITVVLEKGTGVSSTGESWYAGLEIPSFFDGLKKLSLQNDDGAVTPDKPFDPFTAYPKLGSALYIGSDEIFNKNVDTLSIHIKHLSDKIDAVFDIDPLLFSAIGSGSAAGRTKFELYKLSVLEKKQWTNLCDPNGDNFSEGQLSRDVLFKKEADGKVGHLPALNRTPLLAVKEWTPQLVKGFLQLQLNFDFNANTQKEGTGFLNTTDPFQRMALLAEVFKVKEIAVSYFSKLQQLDPEIDQFFHVYPFGITEIYSQPIAADTVMKDGIQSLRTLKTTAYALKNQLPENFQRLDAAKDNLLVNANQSLFPQFTYLSPYDQYKPAVKLPAPAAAKATGKASALEIRAEMMRRKMVLKKDGDAIASRLMLNASGLEDKISGAANQYSGTVQEEGMLLIGLEKAQPLQMISMLFQFAEGSAADEDSDPPEIHWSYLTNNEWRPLKAESLVSDGTAGFQTTGIIKVEIPGDATSNNTIVTSGLFWLSASVTSNSNRIPMLVNVVTQAVLASFEDNNNDQTHFDTALAAGSISKLAVAVAQVAKVQQPFASYDGKHREIGKEFYTRVSERLRHKARAITPWDYEHLVLDRFPSVYKIKCLTHTDPNCLCTDNEIIINPDSTVLITYNSNGGFNNLEEAKIREILTNPKTTEIAIAILNDGGNTSLAGKMGGELKLRFITAGFTETFLINRVDSNAAPFTIEIKLSGNSRTQKNCCGPQIAPGHVLLIPVSNLKNRNAVNPLQPKTSRRVLLDIEAYLQKRVSPFVKVHAKNPVYEQVLVFFRVKFRDGFDKGFYLKKLNDEIVHYLTPWAFDDVAEVIFGQKIYASSIINFIEERNYVDFITDFLMVVCRKGCCEEVIDEGGVYDEKDVLDKIAGCSDMEILLQDDKDFVGDIIAKPSTARSLLVSAPQHIIIPYQEPGVLSPCQRLKIKMAEQNLLSEGRKLKEMVAAKDTPAREITPAAPKNAALTIPQPLVTVAKEEAIPAPVAIVAGTVKKPVQPKAVKKPAVKKAPVKPVKKPAKAQKKK